jgi:hypothetical protein
MVTQLAVVRWTGCFGLDGDWALSVITQIDHVTGLSPRQSNQTVENWSFQIVSAIRRGLLLSSNWLFRSGWLGVVSHYPNRPALTKRGEGKDEREREREREKDLKRVMREEGLRETEENPGFVTRSL